MKADRRHLSFVDSPLNAMMSDKRYYLIIPCVAVYSSPAATFPSSIFIFRSAR